MDEPEPNGRTKVGVLVSIKDLYIEVEAYIDENTTDEQKRYLIEEHICVDNWYDEIIKGMKDVFDKDDEEFWSNGSGTCQLCPITDVKLVERRTQ